MASGMCHNPWLAKSRMFAETIAEVSGLKLRQRSLCIEVNELLRFPLCYFLPRCCAPKTVDFGVTPGHHAIMKSLNSRMDMQISLKVTVCFL